MCKCEEGGDVSCRSEAGSWCNDILLEFAQYLRDGIFLKTLLAMKSRNLDA